MGRRISASEQETFEMGRAFGATLSAPVLVLLHGELGSGKTVFIRGICDALGVPRRMVRSPSFTLINHYTGRAKVVHVDLYRLHGEADLASIGMEEILESAAVVLVEWAERLGETPPEAWRIHLIHGGADRREIMIVPPDGFTGEPSGQGA
jgi:tRNA threonylcarbamoyladenosine biosynthesis protein TsaE